MNDRRFLLARDMTAEEIAKDLPCFVQHEDAGGRCPEKASTVVYGLNFCEAHGSEVASGALLGARQEAADFFERPRNPYVPSLPGLIDEELEALTERLRSDASDDSPYHRALSRAYPEVLEGVRREIDGWKRDEAAGMLTVEDCLLDSLATLHKLLRVAYQDGETWLVENLEQLRQGEAARASYVMRELSPQS
jgi:hypothetical protein